MSHNPDVLAQWGVEREGAARRRRLLPASAGRQILFVHLRAEITKEEQGINKKLRPS